MKRLFILASAAIVALAACTKTEVVYTEAPAEIGFKAITGAMTKATGLGDNADATLGVFANFTSGGEFFGNSEFTSTDGTAWTGGKYWPLEGALDFYVYAPYVAPSENIAGLNSKVLSIKVDNKTDQTDWLYGATALVNKTKANANDIDMAVTLKHALAKVTVNVTSGTGVSNVVLNVTNTRQAGTLEVDYTTPETPSVDWSEVAVGETMNWAVTSGTPFYVVPTDQTSFALTYTLNGVPNLTYTHSLAGATWEAGKSYVYNVNVAPGEITIYPTVAGWDTDLNGNTIADDDKLVPVE